MFASFISGVQRLANGNTTACIGPEGRFIEVTPDGEEVWSYQYPGDGSENLSVFRAERYPADHPAFVGRDLTPSGPIPI
jgi:hypothetical protein